jgi:acyl-coenzyme A synthetase/AMP-(fatty) acid ligase
VADAAVVGRPDEYRGEVLVAHVVPRPGAQPGSEALLAHCRERLAPYKLPAHWQFANALPKTPANKTDKNALRKSIT